MDKVKIPQPKLRNYPVIVKVAGKPWQSWNSSFSAEESLILSGDSFDLNRRENEVNPVARILF